MNWQKAIEILNNDNAKYGWMTPPPSKNIEQFIDIAENKYQIVIPRDYVEFWKLQNGLEFEGNIFYHVDSNFESEINPMLPETNDAFIASNLIWKESLDPDVAHYTFLGDGNIDWYVFDTESQKYLVLDKPSGRVVETFETFDDFFSDYLTRLVNQM